MTPKQRWALGAGVAAIGVAALLLVPGQLARTADHLDPPLRTDGRPGFDPTPDTPADIADLYAFNDANNAYFAVTFAGPQPAGTPGFYDRDVLYTLNISTSAPATSPEHQIQWRFGPARIGSGSGIRVENLPGVTGPLEGRVETVLSAPNGIQVYAGVRDDPFFFDLEGFRQTLATGTLSFNNQRNFFRGQNDTVFVISIPRSVLNTNAVDVWTTTARFGGQL
jgi:hypothetical protein